jgi:hypothetical protein
MGCALIAHHRVPTLVLADGAPLMDQWRERLTTVLDIDPAQVGQLGGGKTKATRFIDLVRMQTVARMDDADTRCAGTAWSSSTRATAYRRNGLGPIHLHALQAATSHHPADRQCHCRQDGRCASGSTTAAPTSLTTGQAV